MDFEKVNDRQKNFYETKRKNFVTKVWSYFRNGKLNELRKQLGVDQQIYSLHKGWCGDLSKKKVLDLGCFEGNALSLYLAQEAREYIGIDLSEKGIQKLSSRIKHLPNAKALTIDFLSEDFREKDFDIIYAYGVLHHFKNVEHLIVRLKEKLKKGGIVISHDPLKTSFPIKILRNVYRPFQTDRYWEWPFSKSTYYKFERSFEIIEKRGVFGKAKYAAFINILPLSEEKKENLVVSWHNEDWERSQKDVHYMFSCMHLSMLMKKKE